MANIKNYNFNKIDAFLSNSQYYDFYLAQDEYSSHSMYSGVITGDCLVVHFDFNDTNIFSTGSTSADTIYSLVTWTGATNTGHTLTTFGYTGLDNGFLTYTKASGDTTNTGLTQILTGTTVVIPSGETSFTFNLVTGSTQNYIYPTNYVPATSLQDGYTELCGGFYQGYWKLDGYDYEVLPSRMPKAWTAEFWVNRTDDLTCSTTGTTLNDLYPDNKGFFFYMGTRAENKFWNVFTGNTVTLSGDCGFCTETKEADIRLTGGTGGFPITLSPPTYKVDEITNQFMIYGRSTADGTATCGDCGAPASGQGAKTVCSFEQGDTLILSSSTFTRTYETNPFILYGRATGSENSSCGTCGSPSGFGTETVCSYESPIPDINLDPVVDVLDNAIGFRIKDDGAIGYRALRLTGYCSGDTYVTGVTIEEQYSLSGAVSTDEWEHIAIRYVMAEEYDDCDLIYKPKRIGRLLFYVNSKLKLAIDDFDELIFKRLNEYKDKQLGVPYNFSLGGGSQGLLESMTFDGQDPDDLGLAIETNFAGTFIGGLSQFRFYICDLNWCDITNNYIVEMDRYDGGSPGIFSLPFNNVFI